MTQSFFLTKAVQSDSGAIGGSVSHEYMVLTDTAVGENDVFYCDCGYAANSNHAESKLPEAETVGKWNDAKIIDTPNTHSIEELWKIYRLMCFNVLIGNRDDHAKNFSFIYLLVTLFCLPSVFVS